jgi:hypothetical protein
MADRLGRNPQSLAARPHKADWGTGYPSWFIAAFPDVAKWVSETVASADFRQDPAALAHVAARDAKIERLITEAGIQEDDEDALKKLFLDNDERTSPTYGRLLAEWYVESTGRLLETSVP